MAEAQNLEVKIDRMNGAVVLRPTGDIDLARSPAFRREIMAAQGEKPGRVVIDLRDVPYMDSSGLATLVEAMQFSRKNSVPLVLCGMQQRVRGLFEIARLHTVFRIVPGVDEALVN